MNDFPNHPHYQARLQRAFKHDMEAISRRSAIEPDLTPVLVVPEGSYRVRKGWRFWQRGGWIAVTHDKDGMVSLMWTSHKDYHLPTGRHVSAVDVSPSGQMVAFYETAISLWMKWGYGKGSESDRRRGLAEAEWMASRLAEI